MTLRGADWVILRLVDIGVIRAEDAFRMLGAEPEPQLPPEALLAASSRLGQTWEALADFSVVGGLVYPSGYRAWAPAGEGEPFEVKRGDHLLVVGQTLLNAQTVLHLESGGTFTSAHWQEHAMIVCAPEGDVGR